MVCGSTLQGSIEIECRVQGNKMIFYEKDGFCLFVLDVFCAQETMMCLRRNTCSKVVQYVFCRDKSK